MMYRISISKLKTTILNESNESKYEQYRKAIKEKFNVDINDYAPVMNGGRGSFEKLLDYDLSEILSGIEVEAEHTNRPLVALEITLDHLSEFKNYYTNLKKMEVDMENENTKLEEKELTKKARENLKDSDFVFQKERKYPIHDISHARNALARVAQHGSPEEISKVKKAVYSRYPELDPDKKEKLKEDKDKVYVPQYKPITHHE